MKNQNSKPKRKRVPRPHSAPRPGAVMYTRRQIADILELSVKVVGEMAANRSGPPFVKLGAARNSPVRYPAAMFQEWLDSRLVASKGDAT